jgi:S-DNA-T family DNA segregation ATPase FtsK/SpoIIIE
MARPEGGVRGKGDGEMHSCDDCTFTYTEWATDALPDKIRSAAEAVARELLTANARPDGPGLLRTHPMDGTWSALEYACHLRDMLAVQRERVRRAQLEESPDFEPMGRDERVVRDRYNEQDPASVAADLTMAADALACDLEMLDDLGWQRTGVYSWPTVENRSMVWVGQHTLHELVHHHRDIELVLGVAV